MLNVSKLLFKRIFSFYYPLNQEISFTTMKFYKKNSFAIVLATSLTTVSLASAMESNTQSFFESDSSLLSREPVSPVTQYNQGNRSFSLEMTPSISGYEDVSFGQNNPFFTPKQEEVVSNYLNPDYYAFFLNQAKFIEELLKVKPQDDWKKKVAEIKKEYENSPSFSLFQSIKREHSPREQSNESNLLQSTPQNCREKTPPFCSQFSPCAQTSNNLFKKYINPDSAPRISHFAPEAPQASLQEVRTIRYKSYHFNKEWELKTSMEKVSLPLRSEEEKQEMRRNFFNSPEKY